MPSRNPSCEKCGSTMYRKQTKAGDFWFCIKQGCGGLMSVIWVA